MDLPMRPGLDTIPADEQKRYESEDKEIIAVVGSGSRGAYLSNDYWVASADVIGYAFSEKPEELHELKTRLVWAKASDVGTGSNRKVTLDAIQDIAFKFVQHYQLRKMFLEVPMTGC